MIRYLAAAAAIFGLVSTSAAQPMGLGVQTHFSQGWPIGLLDKAKDLNVVSLRDGLPWASVEQKPGQYDFSVAGRHVQAICQAGMDVSLTIEPRNPIYDGGDTVYSAQGMAAYAAYLGAVVSSLPDCVVALEIGNEINGKNGIVGPAKASMPGYYASLLSVVYPVVKERRPSVRILGGSTNVIGTGFLEDLFKAGALEHMDAVVIHPYRSAPEGVDMEIERLREAMQRNGGEKPIWATEFGNSFASYDDAPPYMLKMVALMAASGIERAYWYALRDQDWFPDSGLLTTSGSLTPASDAYRLASQLLAAGTPRRVPVGDRLATVIEFGQFYVAWGGNGRLSIPDTAKVLDSRGREIAAPAFLSDEPIVVVGAEPSVEPGTLVADSLLDFGRAPFSYFGVVPDGTVRPLSMVDWEWTSYLGDRWLKPLRINNSSLAPAGTSDKPIGAKLRYKAAGNEQSLFLSLQKTAGQTNVSISVNGKPIWTSLASGAVKLGPLPLVVQAGDAVDLDFAPVGTESKVVSYRLCFMSTIPNPMPEGLCQ